MAYNHYGGHNPYGAPPGYGGYPGSAPGMAAPPGLGPPPGMGPPPGIQHANLPPAPRAAGLPPNFQAPTNMPNINFNAPVIRLGTGASAVGPRPDDRPAPSGRPGLGMERGQDQGRMAARESMQTVIPPTHEEKLRTIFIHQIPEGLGGDEGLQRLLAAVGKLKRWDPSVSVLDEHKGKKFGFALYEDPESLATAVQLLRDEGVEVPVKRQPGSSDAPREEDEDEDSKTSFDGIEKTKLQVAVDQTSISYLEAYKEGREDQEASQRLEAARLALKQAVRELFYPPRGISADPNGDVGMGNTETEESVEVVNIPLAQEDELADIPAEMREVVAGEIAAFRERSNRRDMERLKREEELEELERRRNGATRPSRLDSPPGNSNSVPLGPRGGAVPNAPSGPKGQQNGGRGVSFVNGGVSNADHSLHRDDEDTDASDEELYRRTQSERLAEEDKMYSEAERKWVNRERSRQAALDREQEREKHEVESLERRRAEQLEREKTWDDEREASRKTHIYYRERAGWARKRALDRAEEEARDEADRSSEQAERRREQAQLERARGMADSFLDRQAQEMEAKEQQQQQQQAAEAAAAAAAAPQPFKLSLGAAAQRAQASRAAPQRRTIAEVEGLLDDEEAESTKRQLVPIQMDALASATAGMSEEEISQAVRALAQEIPSEREGLWRWEVRWEYMDDSAVKDKLRPFVEKKIVEYLGVQEEMLVEAVEDHLRKHGDPASLVEELEGALDDEAEDLVKKLWRMVIFLTECEKRGLPA